MTRPVSRDYPRSKRPSEKAVERMCDELYLTAGCELVRFSQPRNTMQTPGVPDRLIYHIPSRQRWWHEVKAPGGKQSPDQRVFQQRAESCGETYVLGGYEAALAQLHRARLAQIRGPHGQFTLTPGAAGCRP